MSDTIMFVRCKLKATQPWRWAILFFWFSVQIYMNVISTGSISKLSFFDIVLYGMPSFNFGIAIWFPLSLYTVVPCLSFTCEHSTLEDKWKKEKNWKKWMLSYTLYSIVISAIIIFLYLGTYLLICALFFGIDGFDFANIINYKMWEGYALIPTGSLLSNFIIYVLCLFSYCIFYIILILFINVYCKQNYGILGPLFIHCILFLWWEFQIHELTQSLIHQKFMRLMMQSWIGLLIWITITSVFLYLIYKRMPFVLSKEKNDSSLNHFRQPFFVSKWFWISTLLFTAIVLYSLWNTPSPDYYTSSFGAEKAGINLYFQAFTSISWLWTSYAYIFAFLSCIDIYRNSYKDQTPWKSLLHAALRGIMMSICTSIFVIVFCTITTGNLYISESIHAMLFSDSIVNSVLHGSILVFIHQLIWLPIATMAGYCICSIIRNWHYCFSILAFFFSCGSYILNTILQGTFLDSCVPVAPFSIGPQAIEFKILFKEWTFLFCLIVLVMVFSRYYHKKTTMVSKEKFI